MLFTPTVSTLTDVTSLELGPCSTPDAHFMAWLGKGTVAMCACLCGMV